MAAGPLSARKARGVRVAALGGVLVVVAVGAGLATVATAPPARADSECKIGAPQWDPDRPAALARLDSERAWTLATGKGVVVAVVDSGVDSGNAHLVDAVQPGTDLVSPGGSPDGLPDTAGHGTAIAGEIAAREVKDKSGVVGLAKDSQILPVRVYYTSAEDVGAAGAGPDPASENVGRVADGIRYAAEHGAKIINVSISSTTDDAGLKEAVKAATDAHALVVASAGNRKTSPDKTDSPRYPAAYPEVLSVTAVDDQDQPTDDSIHGAHVDVAAPGTNVLTTFHADGDCLLAQKEASASFATAYVSAAAALVAERFPNETPAQWAYRLEVTASRPIIGTRDNTVGWGVIRPYEALSFVDDGTAPGPQSPSFDAVPPPQASKPAIDVGVQHDPLAPAQAAGSWWLLGGASALVGALLVSRLKPRRRR